jgi:hypothetical protein
LVLAGADANGGPNSPNGPKLMQKNVNLTTDELLTMLGAKEVELFAARRDQSHLQATREAQQNHIKQAVAEIARLRAENTDLRSKLDKLAGVAVGAMIDDERKHGPTAPCEIPMDNFEPKTTAKPGNARDLLERACHRDLLGRAG